MNNVRQNAESRPVACAWLRCRLHVAVVAAACGFLVLPSLYALGLLVRPALMLRRRGSWRGWGLLLAVAGLAFVTPLPMIGFGVQGVRARCRHTQLRWAAGGLSKHLHIFFKREGRVPRALTELRQWAAPHAYDIRSGKEWTEPRYRTLSSVPEGVPVVIAVVGDSEALDDDALVAYIVLGDFPTAHFVAKKDLWPVLRADNAIRRLLGEKALWDDADWPAYVK